MKRSKKIFDRIWVVLLCIGVVSSTIAGAETKQPEEIPANNPKRSQSVAYTIYVAPSGSDISGDGTFTKPFKTLEMARDKVRELPKNKGDIIVEIADGFYSIDQTLMFDERDSGNEDCTIYYQAANGAKPVLSGGYKLTGSWQNAESDITWSHSGTAYKIPLTRDSKLRAVYVNGQRAGMTKKSGIQASGMGSYKVTKGQAEWAWSGSGSTTLRTGNTIPGSAGLSYDTKNPQNIEFETGSTWQKVIVCIDKLEQNGTDTNATFQMPYAAIAQNQGWDTAYKPSGSQTIYNVFEWLKNPGEFYFDQENQMLYYIPREGEDMTKAEVVVPEIDTVIEIRGSEPRSQYAEYITFSGLSIAHSDWNLYQVEDSYGYTTLQGATVNTAYGTENWHNDVYRSFDVPAAAIWVNTARNVRFLDGEVKQTGCLGVHIENDVSNIEMTGNYVGQTGGSGIVVGHPQHVYENDTNIHKVGSNYAGPEREKFQDGTEAVPKNIYITNNYLLENCYFFQGHSPITSFYTYNLQVLHNFVYKCPYSGMSIGWGWCNFDGSDQSKGDIQLPGVPTTTSRNNRISYNRVEEICYNLHDAGGIYTLGQQGNDDWSEHTEMNYNYINAKREPQVANGSRMVNGFHPDEGSAYINFIGNVVTNIIRNVYELNDWRRKHDMNVIGGFSNTSRSETTAPKCKLDQYVDSNYIWPQQGHDIVLNSGLEDRYKYMIGKDVISDTEYELASHVRVPGGQILNRGGLLSAKEEVWLAPEGTQVFTESQTMTKASGNDKKISAPEDKGEYKLYIKYENGDVSEPSLYTVHVGEDTAIANVSEGAVYNVSGVYPLRLRLNKEYTYILNDKPLTDSEVSSGYTIATEGTWTLVATQKESGSESVTIHFSTSVTPANRLLPHDVVLQPGGLLNLAYNLQDATKTIWIHQSGLSAFDEKDPSMSKATGNTETMKVPQTKGTYQLTIVDSIGSVISQSDARITVGDIKRLEITKLPNQSQYNIGEQFNASGLVVTSYGMDDDKKVLEANEYTLGGFDSVTAGTKTITVAYQGVTAAFQVVVSQTGSAVGIVQQIKAESDSYNSIRLRWSKVNDADGYEIKRSESKSGTYKKVYTVKSGDIVQYTDKKLKFNKKYYYKITAYKNVNGSVVSSADSKAVSAKTEMGRPSIIVKSSAKKQATVTWKKVNGAKGYNIYISNKKSGKYRTIITLKGGTKKKGTIRKLNSGKTYYIKARSYRTVNGKKVYSKYSAAKKIRVH